MITRLSPLVLLYPETQPPPAVAPGALALAHTVSTAFGDGSHPTTRLCATAVDFLCRKQKPARFLDVGTGTGILARIARARGARYVVGTDIDETALRSARANAALDTWPGELVVSDAMPDTWGPTFDLIAANILEGPLRDLAGPLHRALKPGHQLLISGFLPRQTAGLRAHYDSHGFVYRSEARLEEWALLVFEKRQ